MEETKMYPVSEIFTSPQGEGVYTGVLMTFIRLAGCSVGRPFPKERYLTREREELIRPDLLPIYTEQCTLYDGRTFECDTDYRSHMKVSSRDLAAQVDDNGVPHVCITGGEPFIHNLVPLVSKMPHDVQIHIETSGTVPLEKAFPGVGLEDGVKPHWLADLWITVSPKLGVLPQMVDVANEIKLLVDDQFDIHRVPSEILEHKCVYIQPVNFEHKVDEKNLSHCLKIQKLFPHFRVSVQMHKIMGVR